MYSDGSGIFSIVNNDMFDSGSGGKNNTNNLFTSRFLQNQPKTIRENIEANMQDYYTV